MRALVCGAGIAGLALAERLAAAGWQVVVVERAPGPRDEGYMIDFFGPGYEAAARTGLLPRLQELAYDVEELTYVDAAGRRRAGIGYRRFAGAVDGRLLSLLRPDLERALREQVPDAVELRHGCSVAAVAERGDAVEVMLTDGTRTTCDVVVGADGVHSRVRELVHGDERRFLRHLGLHVLAYTVDDPALAAEVGDRFTLTDSVDRTMGLYRLRDGRVTVWGTHRSADPSPPADVRAVLRDRYASLGWVTPAAIDRCPPDDEVYADVVAQVEVPAWSRGRVTLVGDAAGAVSLLAGQGASLALAGAHLLGEHLARVDRAEEVPAVLAAYERRWRPVVTARQRTGREGVEWFLPSTTARLRLRRAALRLMAVPGLDRLLGRGLVGKTRVRLDVADRDLLPPEAVDASPGRRRAP